MTRPKVDPDKRIRTAQACESCKRRKQKCNGQRPCGTCTKRYLTCVYGEENGSENIQASPKRRTIDPSLDAPKDIPVPSPIERQPILQPKSNGFPQNENSATAPIDQYQNGLSKEKPGRRSSNAQQKSDESMAFLSSTSNRTNGQDEEAVVYTSARMLQDPGGRLLYIGDSAVLSFLQLIRMIVETVSGPSSFTQDPMRHHIVENTISLPANFRHTHLLPDRQTANVLVDSYFMNVNGLVEICHQRTFMITLDQCYTDPLSIDPNWLCLLHLMFAIGLVMASPVPGSEEDAIIKKLRADTSVSRAETFYANAKNLSDPSTGFEDSGFWSIQALTLMSVYMLAVSRRNAAYAYYGMAVRSAFALGLHREETMCIFNGAEQSVRRNLWRTLFVLDRFLSTSLGRPTAIRESDCSGNTLLTGERAPFPEAPFPTAANATFTSSSLEASVRSCHVIGVILEKVYSKRKISTKLAQEFADHCKDWPKALDPSLNHRQAHSASPSQGIAILHANLLYCHSIILFTRPFFLFLMNKKCQSTGDSGQRVQVSRMEKFAVACVVASTQSITLVQSARETGYLSQRNPFVLYFLFAATLVVLSNEFCGLYHNPNASTSLFTAIHIMHYFAEQDPQARRLLSILTSFRDVVAHQQLKRAQQQDIARASGVIQPSTPSLAEDNNDAMANLFHGNHEGVPFPNGLPPLLSPTAGFNSMRRDPQQMSFSPHNAPPSQLINHFPSPRPYPASPQSSMDAFFDLPRVSSYSKSGSSNDGNDSLSNDEIDFEALWQFPNANSAVATHGIVSSLTPGSILGGTQSNMHELSGVSESHVPLFSVTNTVFGGQH